MNFVFHKSAREELNKSVDYYRDCEIDLGYDFLEEVFAAIKRIQAYPEAWSPFSSKTRRCLVHRFPYFVVYRIINNEIQIVAIANSHQKPNYWQKRLKQKKSSLTSA